MSEFNVLEHIDDMCMEICSQGGDRYVFLSQRMAYIDSFLVDNLVDFVYENTSYVIVW